MGPKVNNLADLSYFRHAFGKAVRFRNVIFHQTGHVFYRLEEKLYFLDYVSYVTVLPINQ